MPTRRVQSMVRATKESVCVPKAGLVYPAGMSTNT